MAGSVPHVGFQLGTSVIESCRRAVAIEYTKICQKPLFASLDVSSYFFKGGIEIGMRSDGKVHQRKRKPVTSRLQESFLTRPAGKETRHAEMIRQRLKSGALAKREEPLGK